jgi:sugar transferase (PEP-CTERM/EpsH1 system associated)
VNILYLCHRIPFPPDKGDKIRSFHQIEYLSQRHRLHVACFVDAKDDLKHVPALARYCASLEAVYRSRRSADIQALLALPGSRPLSVAAFHSRELARRIERRIATERIDLAIVFSSAMAQYVPGKTDFPVIVDFVDVDSEKWRVYADFKRWPLSWIYRIEAARLRRYEEGVARACDRSLFVAEREAEFFRELLPGARVGVIPNGVDLEYFRRPSSERRPTGPPCIVFVGMMDYFPNVDAVTYFATRIFPLVLKASPDARFRIVGRNPTRDVSRLAARTNVEVTGAVPDVRPFLAEASLSVAPFRIARGVQNKILEAMAMEVPVVGTPTAFQGIAARAEDGVRIAEMPEGIAAAIVDLLRDEAARRDCGERARRYVEQSHRWTDHGVALSTAIDEAVAHRRRRLEGEPARRAGA